MHKWLTITLFPRDDVRSVRNDKLLILYAMVNKIKISQAQALVKQWLMNFKMMGPIEYMWRNHPKLLGPGALIFVAKQL